MFGDVKETELERLIGYHIFYTSMLKLIRAWHVSSLPRFPSFIDECNFFSLQSVQDREFFSHELPFLATLEEKEC